MWRNAKAFSPLVEEAGNYALKLEEQIKTQGERLASLQGLLASLSADEKFADVQIAFRPILGFEMKIMGILAQFCNLVFAKSEVSFV